ncbi:MAG: ParB N-terminal domain-containing protein [Elusimicrobia bacterium]|nr:ParB N-terminal domain-containing protein [Elusimicrobiota bacterium]
MKKRRQNPAGEHPRQLKTDKTFTPISVDEDDELFPNGIFEFNVTKMLAFIEANADKFPVETVEVEPFRVYSSETLDEDTIRRADVSKPILLAEISPGRFNVIDGNHRVERAGRDGLKTIPARRIGAEQHLAFLTSVRAYETYVSYWNSKLDELE